MEPAFDEALTLSTPSIQRELLSIELDFVVYFNELFEAELMFFVLVKESLISHL